MRRVVLYVCCMFNGCYSRTFTFQSSKKNHASDPQKPRRYHDMTAGTKWYTQIREQHLCSPGHGSLMPLWRQILDYLVLNPSRIHKKKQYAELYVYLCPARNIVWLEPRIAPGVAEPPAASRWRYSVPNHDKNGTWKKYLDLVSTRSVIQFITILDYCSSQVPGRRWQSSDPDTAGWMPHWEALVTGDADRRCQGQVAYP